MEISSDEHETSRTQAAADWLSGRANASSNPFFRMVAHECGRPRVPSKLPETGMARAPVHAERGSAIPPLPSVQPYDGEQLTQSPQQLAITFNGVNVPGSHGELRRTDRENEPRRHRDSALERF